MNIFFTNSSKKELMISLVLLVILILFPLFITNDYILHIMIVIFIYAIAAEAWNILGGYTGQISLGNAMFFGIGAYSSSILLSKFNINPWIGMLVGGLFAVLFAIIIGYPVFRLRGHYFVIATLAAGEVLRIVFLSWEYVGGAAGIELPFLPESVKNMTFLYNKSGFYYITLIALAVFVFLFYLLTKSKLGYYFRTIREEEDAAKSIGINVSAYKLVAISLCAFFTAIAGTMYAQYLMYIDPAMVFPISISVKFVLIAALGGAGTIFGPIIGAFILVPITEIARIAFGGGGQGIDLLFYGVLITIIALFRPDGLITLLSKRNSDIRRLNTNVNSNES